MKIGDKVRLIGMPPDIRDDQKLQTRQLFEKCMGQTFTIAGLETVDGLPYAMVRLDVGQVLGKAPYLETIWIEPEYLLFESPS